MYPRSGQHPIYNKDLGGWITVAGTSVSAPLLAVSYGLAGNASTIPLGYAYCHRRALSDITTGNNASSNRRMSSAETIICAWRPRSRSAIW